MIDSAMLERLMAQTGCGPSELMSQSPVYLKLAQAIWTGAQKEAYANAAKVCESMVSEAFSETATVIGHNMALLNCAEAIRNRGEGE